LVDESGKTLTEIVDSVKKVTDIVAEIAAASQEQSVGIEQVNKAITQMDEVTQQNAALVEEAAAASRSMEEQARRLVETMGFFRTGRRGGGKVRAGGFPRQWPRRPDRRKKPAARTQAPPVPSPAAARRPVVGKRRVAGILSMDVSGRGKRPQAEGNRTMISFNDMTMRNRLLLVLALPVLGLLFFSMNSVLDRSRTSTAMHNLEMLVELSVRFPLLPMSCRSSAA
jgi:hypothetical protein